MNTPHHGLTPRQIEVIGLVGRGYPWKRIAADLGISIKTVEKHLENASQTLMCPNNSAWWVRLAEAFHLVPRDVAIFK